MKKDNGLSKVSDTNSRTRYQAGFMKSKAQFCHPKSAKSNDYTLLFNNFNSTNRKEIKLANYTRTINQKPVSYQYKPKTAKNQHKLIKVDSEDPKVSI